MAAFQMGECHQFAHAGMDEAIQFDRLDLARLAEVDQAQAVVVIENGSRHQGGIPARRELRRPQAIQGHRFAGLALVERFAKQQALPAVLQQVQHTIAHAVAIADENFRVILGMSGRECAPFGFVQLFEFVGAQVAAVGFLDGHIPPLGIEIDDIPVDIAIAQMNTVVCKEIIESRFGKSALDGDQHGLVILIAVLVKHDQDLIQQGKNKKRTPADQFRILHGNMRRQERFRQRAAIIHAIQAQAPGQVADESDAIPDDLRGEVQAGGEK